MEFPIDIFFLKEAPKITRSPLETFDSMNSFALKRKANIEDNFPKGQKKYNFLYLKRNQHLWMTDGCDGDGFRRILGDFG